MELQPPATFRVEPAPAPHVGQTRWGDRRLIRIVGGSFDGPRLSGEVLPGGADWQVVHEDGTAGIDTRYTLRTHDGALLYIQTQGIRHGGGPADRDARRDRPARRCTGPPRAARTARCRCATPMGSRRSAACRSSPACGRGRRWCCSTAGTGHLPIMGG